MTRDQRWGKCRYALAAGGWDDGVVHVYGCSHPHLSELFFPVIDVIHDHGSKTPIAVLCDNTGHDLGEPEIESELDRCRRCVFYTEMHVTD